MIHRLRCRVLYCNRTRGLRKGDDPEYFKDPSGFFVCGAHWRLVDRRLRRRISLCSRIAWKKHDRGRDFAATVRLYKKLLEKAARQANERAAGISAAERPPRRRGARRPAA